MAMQVFSVKVGRAYHITRGFCIATKPEQRFSYALWTDYGQPGSNGKVRPWYWRKSAFFSIPTNLMGYYGHCVVSVRLQSESIFVQ